jgi:hypothetical protein
MRYRIWMVSKIVSQKSKWLKTINISWRLATEDHFCVIYIFSLRHILARSWYRMEGAGQDVTETTF